MEISASLYSPDSDYGDYTRGSGDRVSRRVPRLRRVRKKRFRTQRALPLSMHALVSPIIRAMAIARNGDVTAWYRRRESLAAPSLRFALPKVTAYRKPVYALLSMHR